MSPLFKLFTIATVAGAAVPATARPASAQGRRMLMRPMPVMNTVSPIGGVMMPSVARSIPAAQMQSDQVLAAQLQFDRARARFQNSTGPFGPYGGRMYYSPMAYGGYSSPNYSGGYGYPLASYNMFPSTSGYGYGTAARESSYLQEAQKNAGYGNGTGSDRPPDPWKDAPEAVKLAVSKPPEKDINSGQALNVLLKVIPGLVAAGGTADPPFLPPDLLAKVTFAGGPAADALNMVRAGKVEFPPAVSGAEFDAPRTAIGTDLAAASRLVRDGKTIAPELVGRLAADVGRLHPKAAVDGETAVALARLGAAARFLKSVDANGLFEPGWQTAGATLRDLGQFMARHKMEFGPAAPGAEPLYWALHRAMVEYVKKLAVAKG